MGNCMESSISNKELKFNFDKQVTAEQSVFRSKDADKGAMQTLNASSNKPPQLARTYKKESVRVTVY